MIPLKISNLFERPPPAAGYVPLTRARAASAQSPKLPAVEAELPEHERRMRGNRRAAERREKEQALFLDTRTSGRRRSNGRRAEDQQDAANTHRSISIRA